VSRTGNACVGTSSSHFHSNKEKAELRWQHRKNPKSSPKTFYFSTPQVWTLNCCTPIRITNHFLLSSEAYPRASLCEEAGSVCVIRTVRGVAGGDVSHLMVALSSRPSSSTAAIWWMRAKGGDIRGALGDWWLNNLFTASLQQPLNGIYGNVRLNYILKMLILSVPFSCVSSNHWAVQRREKIRQLSLCMDKKQTK